MVKTPVVLYKILIMGIILLFIGAAISPTIGADTTTYITFDFYGSLLGYVNDTHENPIEGALVRVHFHGTYEEDYSDSTGFYHVTNIPICYCMKNATCSKKGYKTEWLLLSIAENTTHDFILTRNSTAPNPPIIDGPTGGGIGIELEYTFVLTDPNENDVMCFIDWDDGTITETGGYPSGTNVTVKHSWIKKGVYTIKARAMNSNGAFSEWSALTVTISNPPTIPVVEGPIQGKPGVEICFTFHSTDPDGDDVMYIIDWGDGITNETDYYPCDVPVEICHTWNNKGCYPFIGIAKDIHGVESDCFKFLFWVDGSRISYISLFQLFFDSFPFLEVFLRTMNLLR